MKRKLLFSMILILTLVVAGCASQAPMVEEPAPAEEPMEAQTPEEQRPVETEESAETEGSGQAEDEVEIVYLDDFVYEDAEGNEVRLSDYAGKLVIIDFWATSCGYCIKEMPELARLDEEYDEVVVISASIGDNAKSLQKFIDDQADKGVTYGHDLVLDANNSAWGFNVSGTPHKVFVGPNREFVVEVRGAMDYDQNKAYIDRALQVLEEVGIDLY
jgi:thiol-disulfide isomerase/thioredoxin